MAQTAHGCGLVGEPDRNAPLAAADLPVENLPEEAVMTVEEMVDGSLAGLDQGELITIPSLPDVAGWESSKRPRKALGPNLTHKHSAAGYGIGV